MDQTGVVAISILGLMHLSLVPGIVAWKKGRSFMLWWFYGIILFPVALFHCIFLRKKAGGVILDQTGIHFLDSWRARRQLAGREREKKEEEIERAAHLLRLQVDPEYRKHVEEQRSRELMENIREIVEDYRQAEREGRICPKCGGTNFRGQIWSSCSCPDCGFSQDR